MSLRRCGILWLTGLLLGACHLLERPLDLQAQVDAAPGGGTITVPAGTWTGDLVIRKPVTLRGAGWEQTTLAGAKTLVVESAGVTLRDVTVVATETALRLAPRAQLTLRGVRVEGPGKVLLAEEGAALETDDLQAQCRAKGLAGISIQAGRWVGRETLVTGPCKRSVELVNATVELRGLAIAGARDAGLHALTSTLEVNGLTIDGVDKASPSVFAARSTATLRDVRITGGEEGLLIRGGETHVERLTVSGTSASALAAIGGKHVVSGVTATGPFLQAALSALLDSTVTASDVVVTNAGAVGVLAVRASADVNRMSVEGLRGDADGDYGHGFVADRSRATFRHVRVAGAEGAAVYASGHEASIEVEDCEGSRVAAGVMLALGARARVNGLHVTDAPTGLVASGSSHLRIRESRIQALVGMLVCQGSTIDEQPGLNIRADRRRGSCEDETFGAAWNQILTLP